LLPHRVLTSLAGSQFELGLELLDDAKRPVANTAAIAEALQQLVVGERAPMRRLVRRRGG
jgi:hypothetical protein